MNAERIVERAMKEAQAAQAVLRRQETSAIRFENDRLKSAESSQRTEVQVRVIVDGKAGVSSTTDPGDVAGVVARALEAAQFGSPAHYTLPGPAALSPVKTYDPTLPPLTKPELIALGQTMIDAVKAYNAEILVHAEAGRTIQHTEFANSAGAAYTAEHADFDLGMVANWVRGADILMVMHGMATKRRDLDAGQIAAQAIGYLRMAERIAPVATGEMPVIFAPRGSVALLLSLALGLDGKEAYLGASPLRDKVGQPIADRRFMLADDPLLDYGPGSSAFDGEGVPRRRVPLIEAGVLCNFVYDLDTAGRAGVQPTGHGPDRRYTNLVAGAGDTPFAEMLGSVKQGLLVHDFLGLGQGNPINGEFSVNVALGYKIEGGEIAGRVKDVMLAGNAYAALRDIVAISREREWVSGRGVWLPGLLPYIHVGRLSVVAK
jgi:PmbA protein